MPRRGNRSTRVACLAAVFFTLSSGCRGSSGSHWQPLEVGAGGPGGTVTISSLLAGGDGQPWLAVGWRTDARGGRSPQGWSSPDGLRWSSDPTRAVTLDGPLDRLAGLARRGDVAVTAGQTQSPSEGNLRPAMWHRDSDGAWHEAPALRELFGGQRGGGLDAVASLSSGLLVAGGWTGLDGLLDIGVWTSVDGATWTRHDGDPGLSPHPGESIRPIAAAGGTPGVVVAGEADLGSRRQGALWWSADNRAWTRADVVGSISLQEVVAVPGGFVALGLGPDGSPTAWRSADGTRWVPAGGLPAPRGATIVLSAAAADRATVWVGGLVGGRARLWRSAGGGRWRAVALPPGADNGPASRVAVAAAAGAVEVAVDRGTLPALWRSD